MSATVENPILRGFSPDPSLLKVGDDYYLATSTFEWWPGVEIYHSVDLVNWTLVAEPLNDPARVDLRGVYDSGAIWAPHLSYAEDQFWLVYTIVKSATAFKDTLNYVITSPAITGPWSKPTFISASGFDPALFHDDDGRHYFMNMLFDHRLDHPGFAGVVMQEFDAQAKALIGERRRFFPGTSLGVCEGPQIMKRNGWYYLLCAAGGTGYSHASTVARSRNIWGPYELSPWQPLISTKYHDDLPLAKAGHACFVQGPQDDWYIVFLCARPLTPHGNNPLGRETGIQPLVWEDDWPHLANGTHLPDQTVTITSAPATAMQVLDHSQAITFDQRRLPVSLKTLRQPLGDRASLTARPGWLRLYGRESLSSLDEQTLLAHRWQSVQFTAETCVDFAPTSFQQLAGLVLYYDTANWAYLHLSYDEELHSRYLQLEVADCGKFSYLSEHLPIRFAGPVVLRVQVDREVARFAYCEAGTAQWQVLATPYAADHLSDDHIKANGKLAFTGAMVGICTQDMDQHRSHADFQYFNYQEQ